MEDINRFGTKDRRFIAYPRILGQGLVEVTWVRLRTVERSGCSIGRAIWPPTGRWQMANRSNNSSSSRTHLASVDILWWRCGLLPAPALLPTSLGFPSLLKPPALATPARGQGGLCLQGKGFLPALGIQGRSLESHSGSGLDCSSLWFFDRSSWATCLVIVLWLTHWDLRLLALALAVNFGFTIH